VPSLVVDGQPSTILHSSQIASLLGLPVPAGAVATRVAWDTVTVLGVWTQTLDVLDWDAVLQPTPSRGRTIRNLTVNTFHPFELVPEAFATGSFEWYPDRDDERERALTDMAALRSYADRILGGWEMFLLERGDDLGEDLGGGPRISRGPQGELTFPALLEAQRWHAAWHHRQVVDHCRRQGLPHGPELPEALLADVRLPEDIY
jgi:hypothetical protein